MATPSAQPTPAGAAPAAVAVNLHRIIRDLKGGTDYCKSEGKFGAQLWLIANEDFFANWKKADTPKIDPINRAIRGQALYTAVVFYGPARDAKGQSSVTYDLVVHRPDGSIYDEKHGLPGYQGAGITDERMIVLGRSYLGVTIGPDDPIGTYTVDAVITDGISTLTLKQLFVVE